MLNKVTFGLLVCVWVLVSTNAWAQMYPFGDPWSSCPLGSEGQSGDYCYTVFDDTVTIVRYLGPGGDVVIPDTILDMPVVSIEGGYYAYWVCWNPENPWECVPSQELWGAFQGRSGVTSVTIPSSVTSIGEWAFCVCWDLTSVTIPSSVTSIGFSAFRGCTSLTSLTLPDNVASIGDSAFYGCSGLTSLTLPDSLNSIGNEWFYNCTSLASVTIPDSVISIGGAAFYGCSGLISVTLPDSVTSIGGGAFRGCTSLTSVTIPGSVTSIYYETFKGCASLTSVGIPDSVTSIGVSAFEGCSGLTSVSIPGNVTSIGERAFADCDYLSDAYFLGNAPSLKESGSYRATFYNCASDFKICYTAEATGFTTPTWQGYPAESCADGPPALGSGPHVAAGWWPLLSDSQEGPTYLRQNYNLLWTFSDDFASCSGECTHTAQYQKVGDSEWTSLSVSSDAEEGYAWVELPINGLLNATTYAFRFAVEDCAGQTTPSQTYYFRVATSDAPPAITAGPFLAAGAWPALARSEQNAWTLMQDSFVLWTFSDDYASCGGPVTHRAWYRMVGEESWTSLAVSTDPEGTWYAYVALPVESLDAGTYQLLFDARDCAGQYRTPGYYYFKVELER